MKSSESFVTTSIFLRWLVLAIAAFGVLLLDQGAKGWALTHLAFGQTVTPIPALQDIFMVTLSANRGAAFSLLPQFGDMFLLIATIMITGILFFYRRIPEGFWLERFALGLLVGGAISNVLDRLRFGFVIDFFHVQLRAVSVSNISNFGDHAIVLGVIIILFMQWFIRKPADQSTSGTSSAVITQPNSSTDVQRDVPPSNMP